MIVLNVREQRKEREERNRKMCTSYEEGAALMGFHEQRRCIHGPCTASHAVTAAPERSGPPPSRATTCRQPSDGKRGGTNIRLELVNVVVDALTLLIHLQKNGSTRPHNQGRIFPTFPALHTPRRMARTHRHVPLITTPDLI